MIKKKNKDKGKRKCKDQTEELTVLERTRMELVQEEKRASSSDANEIN